VGQIHEQPESGVGRFRVTVEADIDVIDPIALRNANLAPSTVRSRGADGRGLDLIGVVTQAVRGLDEAECGIRLTAMSAGAVPVLEGGGS
jgi:hypothetical protein